MHGALRDSPASDARARAYWLRTLHQWHWISAAACLVAMLLFSVTGITLNHAARIEAQPRVTRLSAQLPAELRQTLDSMAASGQGALPASVREWMGERLRLRLDARAAEWSDGEALLSMPTPGVDAWLSVDARSGAIEYERTDRGWIAWLNDLHKGRHAGPVWAWFIDLFALACIVFTLSGLALLWLHRRQRALTWPLFGLGLVLPLLIALLFIH